jgi:lysophospholipase L1-like esterase
MRFINQPINSSIEKTFINATVGGGASPVLFGLSKPVASNSGDIWNGNSGVKTSFLKLEAESEFDQVRVWLQGRNDATGWNVAVAPTETEANDTDDNRYKPISGGVVDDSLWVDNISMPDLSGGSQSAPAIVHTDWVDLESIENVDGGRPLILLRVTGADTGSFQSVKGFNLWENASSEDFYRLMSVRKVNGDYSSDAASTTPTGPIDGDNGPAWACIEYRFKNSTKSVYAMGDSITAGGGGQIYEFDNWLNRAVYRKSTELEPWTAINGGMSGNNSTNYTDSFFEFIDQGARPTHVVIPAFTPNDGTATQENSDARFVRIESAIAKCEEIGAQVYLWTGLPVDGYPESSAQWIQYSNDWAIDKCNNSDCILLDFNAIASDGATPMRFKPGYDDGDGIHPSVTLIDLMAQELESKLY